MIDFSDLSVNPFISTDQRKSFANSVDPDEPFHQDLHCLPFSSLSLLCLPYLFLIFVCMTFLIEIKDTLLKVYPFA